MERLPLVLTPILPANPLRVSPSGLPIVQPAVVSLDVPDGIHGQGVQAGSLNPGEP